MERKKVEIIEVKVRYMYSFGYLIQHVVYFKKNHQNEKSCWKIFSIIPKIYVR